MAKKRVDITIEENIWLKFTVYCVSRKKKYSHVIEQLIRNLLNKSQ